MCDVYIYIWQCGNSNHMRMTNDDGWGLVMGMFRITHDSIKVGWLGLMMIAGDQWWLMMVLPSNMVV